jgi:hypothetical protein
MFLHSGTVPKAEPNYRASEFRQSRTFRFNFAWCGFRDRSYCVRFLFPTKCIFRLPFFQLHFPQMSYRSAAGEKNYGQGFNLQVGSNDAAARGEAPFGWLKSCPGAIARRSQRLRRRAATRGAIGETPPSSRPGDVTSRAAQPAGACATLRVHSPWRQECS